MHIRTFANRQRRPLGNEIVTYEIKTDTQGRAQAANVTFVGERIPLAAQGRLRHKTKKASFQLVFRATVALNCGALSWSFSPHGAAVLRSVLTAR